MKVVRAAGVLFLLALVSGCAASVGVVAPSSRSAQAQIAELSGQIRFVVAHGGLEGGPALEHVLVTIVTTDGRFEDIGTTSAGGAIEIERRRLAKGVVLLFSREWYFEGAWRIRFETLRDFDERFFTLAPIALQ